MTATVISTNMSRRPWRADVMARRSVVAPPATTASPSITIVHARGAPVHDSPRPSASAADATASGGTPNQWPSPNAAGAAFAACASSSGQARSPVSATASAIAPVDVRARS